jgi:salicylate hydroxylase
MKKKIAIIGSGIAGLTLANLLQNNSKSEIIVYEKEEKLNLEEGFGIQLSVNCVSVLNKIGFNQLNKNQKYKPLKLDFYSIRNNKICDLDLTRFNSKNDQYTTLKRSTLIKFLKEKLFSNTVIFGKKINDVKQFNNKLKINFTDDSSDEVDYLVVSDGVFSNTKSVIEKNKFKPKYYGAIAIRTQIKAKDANVFDSNNISLIMSPNAHLVLYPLDDQKNLNLVCIIRKKIKNNHSIEEILTNTILKKNKNLVHLFKGDLKSWPIYISDKPIKSIYKNVLYIGDAFYTFPPTLAQGASQAIESANEIFELIKNNNTEVQNEYFKDRVERINLINKRSKLNYFSFHLSNPFFSAIRDVVLKRLVKNEKFLESYLGKIYKK